VKSECLMEGYLGRPEKSQEFFDKDGFAKMPDLVRYDESGKIIYSCRLNDAFK